MLFLSVYRYTAPLTQIINDCSQLEAMVEATIDLQQLEQHEYVINPQFDPELQAVRQQQESILDKIAEMPNRVASDLGIDTAKLRLERNNQFGYFLRITRKVLETLHKIG